MIDERERRAAQQELVGVFLRETRRRLLSIEALLEELESEIGEDVARRSGLLQDLYREAHTIRGGAALTDLGDVRSVAERLELLARTLRDGAASHSNSLARVRELVGEIRRLCASVLEPALALSTQPVAVVANGAEDGAAQVLHVEDDLANRMVVERLFAQRPHVRLITAPTGAAALEFARGCRPDLILLDFNLPDMRGDAVLAVLKSDETTRTIPVVVMSAEPAVERADDLLSCGAVAYLEKPLDLREVLALFDSLVVEARL